MIPWDVLRRQRAAIAELIDEASDEVGGLVQRRVLTARCANPKLRSEVDPHLVSGLPRRLVDLNGCDATHTHVYRFERLKGVHSFTPARTGKTLPGLRMLVGSRALLRLHMISSSA